MGPGKGQSPARDGAESFHLLGSFQRWRAVSVPSATLHRRMKGKGIALPDENSELGSAIQILLGAEAIFLDFSCFLAVLAKASIFFLFNFHSPSKLEIVSYFLI